MLSPKHTSVCLFTLTVLQRHGTPPRPAKPERGAPGRKRVRHSLEVFRGSGGVMGWSPPSTSSLSPPSGSGRLSVGVSASDDIKRQMARSGTGNPSPRAFAFPRHSAPFHLCCSDRTRVKWREGEGGSALGHAGTLRDTNPNTCLCSWKAGRARLFL